MLDVTDGAVGKYHKNGRLPNPPKLKSNGLNQANVFEGQVDFVVVNPSLPRAPDVVQIFGGMHRPKIILIPEQGVEPDTHIVGDAILQRPDPHIATSRSAWVENVRRVLRELQRTAS